MSTTMRTLVAIGLSMLAVAGGAASAGAQSPPAAPALLGSDADVQALRDRAGAFWAARLAGDFQRQWEMLEPRGKGRVTAQEYGADRGGVKYMAYQVEGATVTGFFGTVKVKVLFQPVLPPSAASRIVPPQTSVGDDSWVRIGGVWYRRLDETAPSRAATP